MAKASLSTKSLGKPALQQLTSWAQKKTQEYEEKLLRRMEDQGLALRTQSLLSVLESMGPPILKKSVFNKVKAWDLSLKLFGFSQVDVKAEGLIGELTFSAGSLWPKGGLAQFLSAAENLCYHFIKSSVLPGQLIIQTLNVEWTSLIHLSQDQQAKGKESQKSPQKLRVHVSWTEQERDAVNALLLKNSGQANLELPVVFKDEQDAMLAEGRFLFKLNLNALLKI